MLLGRALSRLFGDPQRPPARERVVQVLRETELQMYARSEKKVADSRAVAVRLHSATPLADPATRGISLQLQRLFEERALTAETPDLRARVVECLRALKQHDGG